MVAEITYTERTNGSLQLEKYNDGTEYICTHDVRGNMVKDGTTTTDYFYDHENRLVHIDDKTVSDKDFWMRYDALGRRVEEKEATGVTLFYYDGVHIVEETDSSLILNRLSLFGVRIDEVLYSGDTDGSGNLQNHRWALADHLGSVVVVVDNSGVVKTDNDYTTAYGETTNNGAESYPYGFTGRRYIETAELYDYRTRAYDPKLGRFLQRDSIGIWGDPGNYGNGYAYTGNNPANRIDALGLLAKDCCCEVTAVEKPRRREYESGKKGWLLFVTYTERAAEENPNSCRYGSLWEFQRCLQCPKDTSGGSSAPDEDLKIEKLTIISHGSQYGLSMGNGARSPDLGGHRYLYMNQQAKIKRIFDRSKFCHPCKIIIYACDVAKPGLNAQDPRGRVPEMIAKASGCTVVAFIGRPRYRFFGGIRLGGCIRVEVSPGGSRTRTGLIGL